MENYVNNLDECQRCGMDIKEEAGSKYINKPRKNIEWPDLHLEPINLWNLPAQFWINDMDTIKYTVESSINDGILHQTVDSVFEDTSHNIGRYIMDAREKHTRDYLISLGWTPPRDEVI